MGNLKKIPRNNVCFPSLFERGHFIKTVWYMSSCFVLLWSKLILKIQFVTPFSTVVCPLYGLAETVKCASKHSQQRAKRSGICLTNSGVMAFSSLYPWLEIPGGLSRWSNRSNEPLKLSDERFEIGKRSWMMVMGETRTWRPSVWRRWWSTRMETRVMLLARRVA